MHDRHDDPLREALAALERHRASPGFTRRLVARLDEAPPPSPGWKRPARWAWAGLAAALLALAVGMLGRARPVPAADLTAEAARLRQTHSELARELEALRALSEESAPILVLESRPDYDLVLDLRPVLDGGTAAGVRPAALNGPYTARPDHAVTPDQRRP